MEEIEDYLETSGGFTFRLSPELLSSLENVGFGCLSLFPFLSDSQSVQHASDPGAVHLGSQNGEDFIAGWGGHMSVLRCAVFADSKQRTRH